MASARNNLALPVLPTPYIFPIQTHPFCRLINQALSSLKIPGSSIQKVDGNTTYWSFTCSPGLCIFLSLYKDDELEPFISFEAAFGIFDSSRDKALPAILLKENAKAFYPFSYGITELGYIVIRFTSFCGGITAEQVLLRTTSIIHLASLSYEKFIVGQGLAFPLPNSWFPKTNL